MFAKGSFLWLASPLVLAVGVTSISLLFQSTVGYCASFLLFLIVAFVAIFFRDPEREIGQGIVSPADGRIDFVDERNISVVMGLRHVHVTRAPHEGEVVSIGREKGRHRPAFTNVSETNERVRIVISSELGDFNITLITGFVARRIFPYVSVGDRLGRGDRIGIIRFGSRVDLSVPESCKTVAARGTEVKAGESQIAEVIDGNR